MQNGVQEIKKIKCRLVYLIFLLNIMTISYSPINNSRNWFERVKLCSIDVGRQLCTGLSFNPTNWRQLCTVSNDVLTLWNVGQLNTKYSLMSRLVSFCFHIRLNSLAVVFCSRIYLVLTSLLSYIICIY